MNAPSSGCSVLDFSEIHFGKGSTTNTSDHWVYCLLMSWLPPERCFLSQLHNHHHTPTLHQPDPLSCQWLHFLTQEPLKGGHTCIFQITLQSISQCCSHVRVIVNRTQRWTPEQLASVSICQHPYSNHNQSQTLILFINNHYSYLSYKGKNTLAILYSLKEALLSSRITNHDRFIKSYDETGQAGPGWRNV